MLPLGSGRLFSAWIGAALILSSTLAFAQDVPLTATWKRGRENLLIHVQPARGGIFIAPNSPVFENDSLIQITDAVSRQSVAFKVHRPHERGIRGFDVAFPQLRRPMNLVVTVRGLLLVDQKGRRFAYSESFAVHAPATADATPRPSATQPPHGPYYSFSGDTGANPAAPGPAAPENTEPTGQGAPPPEYFDQPVAGGAPPPEPSLAPPPEPRGSPPRAGDGQIPQFPFPPPMASAFDTIPRELLVGAKNPKLKDVDLALSNAFANCGYGEKSFYAVPDGFAMASRLEQINADGSFGANRWSLETAPIKSFSIDSYLRALFRARAGRFRVVVFLVTNRSFEQTDARISSDEAKSWVRKGSNKLPASIGDRNFTDDYSCIALIYEFEALGGTQPRFIEPSEITGRTHLEKSGLLAALARQR